MVESNEQQSVSNDRKESLYDEYQRELCPSSDGKSSKGKSAAGDPRSNNKSQQKDEPAASSGMAIQTQNSSGEGSSSRRTKFPKNYEYPPKVHGFDRDEMSLQIMLVEDGKDDSFKSIGVVGPPGVGKTTLCKLILKNEKVKGSYDRMIWVSLSELEKPNPKEGENKEIVEEALEQTGGTEEVVEQIFGENEFSGLLKDPNKQLKENKCLIVFDDVEEEEKYSFPEGLKTCFSHESGEPPRKKGGTIVVISRSEKAAKEVMVGEKLLFHRLMPLSDLKSCWSIYMDAVKGYATPATNASKEVMDELVKKCGGLPGAARMLGRIKAQKIKEEEEKNKLNQKQNNTNSSIRS